MPRISSQFRSAALAVASAALAAAANPAIAQTAAGFTPGSFNVGDSGAASYTVPISVAPGTAGVQPKLALTYNSGSGNGRLGVGWALTGLSAVTRCPRTLPQDGQRGSVKLDGNDRFCLDGQRLVLTSAGSYGAAGTTYGTELEQFSKVTANGSVGSGPAWFEVRTKSGLIIEYGNGNNSQFQPAGAPAVLVWGVSKIRDTKGNYLTVSYLYDNPASPADWYPDRIDYTVNPGAGVSSPNQWVLFEYEARTDIVPAYVAGYLTKTTNRLSKVKSTVVGTVIKEYRLSYDVAGSQARSRLASIQECSGSATCLPATSLTVQSSPATSLNGTGSGLWWSQLTTSLSTTAMSLVADFDGDGHMDLGGWISSNNWRICTYNGVKFSCTIRTAHAGGVSNNFVGDYNGDGKSDLMAYVSGASWNVCLSNGAGFTCSLWSGHAGTQTNNLVGDFDGDGRTDIAAFDNGINQWQVCLSTGSGFNCSYWGGPASYVSNTAIGDFDGDGRTDIAGYTQSGGDWQVCVSTSTSFDCGSQYWHGNGGGPQNNIFGDFNGDGKTDMAAYSGAGTTWSVCLSTGAGFACDSPSINWRGASNTIAADFNGDGRTDLITQADNNTDYLVCFGLYSGGTSFSCLNQAAPLNWLRTGNVRDDIRAGDFNGDGLADIANYSYTTEDTVPVKYFIQLTVGVNGSLAPDVVTKVTNGLGHETTISYQPFSNSAVYTKDSGGDAAVFPDIDIQVPMQVVSSASSANGNGGWVTTNYTYGGAKVNLRDSRGFKGFRWREETNAQTGIKTRATYRQDFPYIGMPSQVKRTLSNGTTVILQRDISYTCKDFTGGCTVATGRRYYPFAWQTTETTRDLDNSFITTVVTTTQASQIDDYGNVLSVEVKNLTSGGADEGFVKTTASTYDNDTTNWLLGRLRTSSVTKTIPGPSSETRSSYFEYDATTGLLTKEVIEPSSSTYCLVTTYGYDAFGNKTSATTRNCSGSSGEAAAPTGDAVFNPRTSYTYFDTSAGCATPPGYVPGRLPVRTVNALGHAECLEHDTRFGAATKLTGPNGLVTTWTYDEFGRKASETRADGTTTSWSYNPWGSTYELRELTTGAPARYAYYDTLNRVTLTEVRSFSDTDYVDVKTEYDARGRVLRVSRPFYHFAESAVWTTYEYDDLDRMTSETLPAASGGTAKKTIAYSGLTTTQTLGNNGTGTNMPGGVAQTKTVTRNSQGQVTQATDSATPTANVVTYAYFPSGNVRDTVAANVVTSLAYDLRGRKTSMVDKDMGYWSYAYNALGELIRQVDGRGQTTTMLYDLLGRMTNRSELDLVSNWFYDTLDGTNTCGSGGVTSLGKLCKAAADNGYVRTNTYDTVGRISSVSATIDTAYNITYGYDASGRLAQTTYPTGYVVKNVYNSVGYLWQITDATASVIFWKANTLSASGKVTSETVSNFTAPGGWAGTPTTRQYDALDRLTSTTTTDDTNAAHTFNFTYDAIGNVLSKVDVLQSSLTESFAYDTRNFLTGTSGSGFTTTSTNYDATGNISYKSNVGTYNYPATSSPQPHAPSSITGTVINCVNPTFTYDANGNMWSGLGRTYTYTSYNMPSIRH